MKLDLKSIIRTKSPKIDNSSFDSEEQEYDKHVDFFYTNIINSITLYTYDTTKLEEMAPNLIDPLTELYEELEYAFTPVCFETVFRLEVIDNFFKNELLEFKKEVDAIPTDIWDWEYMDSHKTWIAIRQKANILLKKLSVTSRIYNDNYTTIYDKDGNIIKKGKNSS